MHYAGENGLTITQASQKVSKWDLKQWQRVLGELKDEDWSPEAKSRLNVVGTLAGMNLGMMVGAIASVALIRRRSRQQKIVDSRVNNDQRTEVSRVNAAYSNPVKIVQKDNVVKPARAVAKTAKSSAPMPKAERILPGADLSSQLWLDGDQTLAELQTRIFNDMVNCRDIDDLRDMLKPHLDKSSFDPRKSPADRVKQEDYVTNRLVRTELARIKDSINTASYIANDIKWVNVVTEPGACSKCMNIASAGPYRIEEAPAIPDSTHPNCRCGKVPAVDGDDSLDSPRTANDEDDLSTYKSLTDDEYRKIAKDQKPTREEGNQISRRSGYIGTNNSFKINDALRTNNLDTLPPESKSTIALLDRLIGERTAPQNMIVTRRAMIEELDAMKLDRFASSGSGVDANHPKIFDANQSIHIDSYFSASASDKTLMAKRKVEIKVYLPKGSNAYISENYRESEVILPRDSDYQLLKYYLKDGKVVIELKAGG